MGKHTIGGIGVPQQLRGLQSKASEIDKALLKPSNYIEKIKDVTTLDGVAIYTNPSSLVALALDGTTFEDGKPVINIHSGGATSMLRVAIDLSGYGINFGINDRKDFGVKLKVKNSQWLSYVNIFIGQASNMTNSYYNGLLQSTAMSGDGYYYLPLLQKDHSVLGTPTSVPLDWLRFDILPLAGNNTTTPLEIEVCEIVRFKKRKSRCMISFDDAHYSCNTISALLDDRGLKGTFYIVSDWIGTNGALTLAETLSIHDRGHDIGTHSKTHETATTIGDSAYFTNQQICRKWIRDNISPRAADHAAPIGGMTTANLISMMQRAGFKSIRKATPAGNGFVNSGWGTGVENKIRNPRWSGNTWGMDNTKTVDQIIDAHQKAIDANQDFFVYGHQVLYTEGSVAWSTAVGSPYSMPDYFDWVKSQVDAGNIEVLTVSEFWQ